MLTVVGFGIALSMVGYGLFVEMRAWHALRRVDDLRRRQSRTDLSLLELRAIILPWLKSIRCHLEEPGRIMAGLRPPPRQQRSGLYYAVRSPARSGRWYGGPAGGLLWKAAQSSLSRPCQRWKASFQAYVGCC